MNKQNKKIAEYAGIKFSHIGKAMGATDEDLERFAELVRQDEREKCARVCENLTGYQGIIADTFAQAIRGRTD
jgi:hypothetical protein